MPSTGSQSAPIENEAGWSHRYGLPSWMRNNLDRLNVSTNFEEYACSPPEIDSGFVPEFESKLLTPIMGERLQIPVNKGALKTSKSAPTLCELERSQHRELSKAVKEATRQNFLASGAVLALPHILGCNSASTSTETTPTSTPQGSPFNARKIMRKEDDSLSPSNGKKWFYTGVFNDKGAETMPMLKENPDCVAPIKKERPQKSSSSSKSYKKFMMSNFDLNAVSPTSW